MTFAEQQAFFAGLELFARSSFRRWKGMRPSCCLAQAGLESGYGSAVIGRANYWGIKALKWVPKQIAVRTNEWNPLTKQRELKTAWFADFAGPQEAFDAYGRLVSNSPIYEKARDALDLTSYVSELARHWASDPLYAGKVMLIISEHNLVELDVAL